MRMFKTLQLIGVLASAGAVAGAAENYHSLHATVPFAFVVAGQTFEPGQYHLTETETGVIMLQGEGKGVAVLSTPLEQAKAGGGSTLRFVNSNNRAYLVSVSIADAGSRAVPAHIPTERALSLAAK